MSSDQQPAIRTVDLAKRYRVGGGAPPANSLREALTEGLKAPLRRLRSLAWTPTEEESFWALSGLSIEVQPGEVLGVVGKNGAGKTTLLKLLSRITEPTQGRIELRGRVSSLLEVGTGFHPELTGRENIYLNGTILGMRKREIDRKLDEIVAFAEIEKFLETPVKRYSSGMYVRLAFAVAAHLEPEILLVDEVLAVGDAAFQKRCLGKLDDIAHEGRTVLFVSHNMAAVERLCTRAILLEKGKLAISGSPQEVISRYLAGEERPSFQAERRSGKPQLLSAELRDENGAVVATPTTARPLTIHLRWVLPEDAPGTKVGIGVLSVDGVPLFTSNAADGQVPVSGRAGEYEARVVVPPDTLLSGELLLAVCLWNDREILDLHEPALTLSIEPGPSALYLGGGTRKGYVHVPCSWTIEPVDEPVTTEAPTVEKPAAAQATGGTQA